MSRTQVFSALILRSRTSGESNRDVWLLSAESGLIRATVFGGPKSKLRAHATPFHSGQVWIYHDPVKDSRKLSDFDVSSWRPGLRELYERAMSADAIAETILASHGGGGNWETALALAEETLDVLESAGEELCERLLVYFLWRWADFLGLQPELENCVSCAKAPAQDGLLWYSPREGGMLCADCAGGESNGNSGHSGELAHNSGLLQVNPGCRRWLAAINLLSPALLNRYTMDGKSFREAKALVFAILTEALGKRLASWEW
ncbi:recombinase RecO [Spirochaetia bacterium]|nr:recombinase RecO [Spirochaetia bacterium]